MARKADTMASVLTQIVVYGPFLPGSVRETMTMKTLKDGTVRAHGHEKVFLLLMFGLLVIAAQKLIGIAQSIC